MGALKFMMFTIILAILTKSSIFYCRGSESSASTLIIGDEKDEGYTIGEFYGEIILERTEDDGVLVTTYEGEECELRMLPMQSYLMKKICKDGTEETICGNKVRIEHNDEEAVTTQK